MVRKKVDERIRTLLSNCVKQNHRSLIVIVGDHGKDQVVNIHYMLSKLQVKARPSVLWCYKKELGFSTYRKKRMRQIKKMVQRGLYDAERDDPFDLFVSSTNIRWAYYKESEKILGQTFGMCVLQDFEALTPNLLARTIETVEGGGTVVVLLKKLDSLKQLYSLAMDVHSRFRTESHQVIKPRFNERWLLALGSCETCMVVDDELNILPISKHMREIKPLEIDDGAGPDSDEQGRLSSWDIAGRQALKLRQLKESLAGTQPACNLVGLSKTVDQATAVLAFLDVVADKSLASTVALTAGRGRGKSAALGIAIASAVAFGYSNIFVTSPSPENLKTVFEFVFKGFDALEYKEHLDYEIVQSTNPDFNKAVVRVSIFHQHRQTIQYIDPSDSAALAQAELVVVDEAAAIPLPLVRKLLGPYLVFLSSTINGYEGTGRSLSLKLISQLRASQAARSKSATEGGWRTSESMYRSKVAKQMAHEVEIGKRVEDAAAAAASARVAASGGSARQLREIALQEPIRYSTGDPVEAWLNRTLCLDATSLKQGVTKGTPPPNATQLFAVDRDVLFSHHSVSEALLQRIVGLFVGSHYKNSPDDLLLLSDAPAHRLFVLLGPDADGADGLPDILCAIQVSLEGGIARENVKASLRVGNRASGDLVPWTVAQQFQDNDFAHLDGARVVRIATNPAATRMGYGKRALELLKRFYQGELINADAADDSHTFENMGGGDEASKKGLLGEKIKPRKHLPPMLVPLSDLRPPRLHYMSVSYGLTQDLFNFWQGSAFRPLYLRQTANDLTGEYTCVMVCPLNTENLPDGLSQGWEQGFCKDFVRRLMSLLCGPFKELPTTLALGLLTAGTRSAADASLSQDEVDAGREQQSADVSQQLSGQEFKSNFLMHDLKRLEAYARNTVDFHMITDLLPRLAQLFFQKRLPSALSLSLLQRALLVGMGLQYKRVEVLSTEYDLPVSQLLALFNKAVRKLSLTLAEIRDTEASAEIEGGVHMKAARERQSLLREGKLNAPINASMSHEQAKAGEAEMDKIRAKQQAVLSELSLEDFAVGGDDETWRSATNKSGGLSNGAVVSLAANPVSSKDKKSKKTDLSERSTEKKREAQKERFAHRSSSKKRHKR